MFYMYISSYSMEPSVQDTIRVRICDAHHAVCVCVYCLIVEVFLPIPFYSYVALEDASFAAFRFLFMLIYTYVPALIWEQAHIFNLSFPLTSTKHWSPPLDCKVS